MRRPFVAGNWKMNGSREHARELVAGVCEGARGLPRVDAGQVDVGQVDAGRVDAGRVDAGQVDAGRVDAGRVDVGICPPFVYLAEVGAAIGDGPVRLGAQSCAAEEHGAFTGDVSASMLADVGCSFVLAGHSERRTLHGESDTEVAAKAAAALGCGLTPVICVGETLSEREADRTEATVARQLDAVLDRLDRDALSRVVIAYEPVWAIGTGRTASPAQANAVHAFLRARVAARAPEVAPGLRIIYGGSVKPENAAGIFAEPDVDGGLVGGASLDAAQFIDICLAAG